MSLILGIDSSTTVTGFAFVNPDTKDIVDAGFIKTAKFKGRYEKISAIMDLLKANPRMAQVSRIFVEASLMNVQGKTSKQTIILLAKHNAVLCFVLEQEFGTPVDDIDPNLARKTLFGKSRSSVKGVTSKQFVAEKVEALYDVKPWCQANKIGNPDKCNEDMYDAVVMAMYGVFASMK